MIKHLVYAKFDGKLAVEYVFETIGEDKYSQDLISFTGNPAKEGQVLKNFEINKTVSFKVGEDSRRFGGGWCHCL